jgi:hypothetical protein
MYISIKKNLKQTGGGFGSARCHISLLFLVELYHASMYSVCILFGYIRNNK